MPELPEIASRAKELNKELAGSRIESLEILQPRCLNIPVEKFERALKGARIGEVTHHGKWILGNTDRGWLLLNMGMGGEVLLTTPGSLPKKYRALIKFEDQRWLAINFWWFGYLHFAEKDRLSEHPMVGKLGVNALDISKADLREMLSGQRKKVKSILLDQSQLAGIGNAYIHDILFLAKIHPLRVANTLSSEELDHLFKSIHKGLETSLKKGGAFYELNIYGKPGGFKQEDILIGYREGKPCPVCGTPILKIKTGGTSSFICPHCQEAISHEEVREMKIQFISIL
jgi:formamidopyrimidine-DNA glycosylase